MVALAKKLARYTNGRKRSLPDIAAEFETHGHSRRAASATPRQPSRA
jgi:hypothetical protein